MSELLLLAKQLPVRAGAIRERDMLPAEVTPVSVTFSAEERLPDAPAPPTTRSPDMACERRGVAREYGLTDQPPPVELERSTLASRAPPESSPPVTIILE